MAEIDNDKLVQDFFAENKQEIADNGFSRRVMRHISERSNRRMHLWTNSMVALGIILFVWLGGFEATWRTLQETFVHMIHNGAANLDLKSLAIAAIVLIFMGIKKVCSLA